MRAYEFTTILESEATEQDSPKQLIKDIEAGAIDPAIAKMGMEHLNKIVADNLLKTKDTDQRQPTDSKTSTDTPSDTNTVTTDQPTTEEITYSKENEAQLRKLLIQQGSSLEQVMNTVTFVYRENIVNNCKKIAASKMYKSDAVDLLASLFYELPATFHQRNNLSNVLVKTGILDLSKFSKPGQGSLVDLIMPKYKSDKAAINLFLKLKSRKDFPTQVSAANKGAGEDLITILGHPVLKLSPGDLNIDGKEIEIKAMGARLKGFGGSDIYGNATNYYNTWVNLISKALGDIGLQYMQENGKSLKKYYHFGLDNLKVLSDALNLSNVPNKQALLIEAFDGLAQVLYPKSSVSMRKLILSAFNKKGFDVQTFRKQWFLFSYDYYKLTTADKKTGATMHAIMFINQGDNSYHIVTESDQISDNWNQYELSTDLFNWTNPTGQAPKITYGKEVRSKK